MFGVLHDLYVVLATMGCTQKLFWHMQCPEPSWRCSIQAFLAVECAYETLHQWAVFLSSVTIMYLWYMIICTSAVRIYHLCMVKDLWQCLWHIALDGHWTLSRRSEITNPCGYIHHRSVNAHEKWRVVHIERSGVTLFRGDSVKSSTVPSKQSRSPRGCCPYEYGRPFHIQIYAGKSFA